MARPTEVTAAALLHGIFGLVLVSLAVDYMVRGGAIPWALFAVAGGLGQGAIAWGLWELQPVARNTTVVLQSFTALRIGVEMISLQPHLWNRTRVGFFVYSVAILACLCTTRARAAFGRQRGRS